MPLHFLDNGFCLDYRSWRSLFERKSL